MDYHFIFQWRPWSGHISFASHRSFTSCYRFTFFTFLFFLFLARSTFCGTVSTFLHREIIHSVSMGWVVITFPLNKTKEKISLNMLTPCLVDFLCFLFTEKIIQYSISKGGSFSQVLMWSLVLWLSHTE